MSIGRCAGPVLALALFASGCAPGDSIWTDMIYAAAQPNDPPAWMRPTAPAPAEVAPARAPLQDMFEQPVFPPTPPVKNHFVRPRRGRAVLCSDPTAIDLIAQPNARERLGDLNFSRLASIANCIEVGADPLIVCQDGQPFVRVTQYINGRAGRCRLARSADMVDVPSR